MAQSQFEWRNFLDVAERLKKSSDEGDLRSAVSRAYYAAFHSARRLLVRGGERIPKDGRAHEIVPERLGARKHMRGVAMNPKAVKAARRAADYELVGTKWQQQCATMLTKAKAVVDRCSEDEGQTG